MYYAFNWNMLFSLIIVVLKIHINENSRINFTFPTAKINETLVKLTTFILK